MITVGEKLTVNKAIKLMRKEGYKFVRITKDKMVFSNDNQKVTIVYNNRVGDDIIVKEVRYDK